MAADIPTSEPSTLRVGDTWSWKRSLTDYPAPTWTLSYVLINATDKITVTAAASGSDHLVTVAKATTAAYKAGAYHWTAAVTDGTSRYTIEEGDVELLPDLAASATARYDTRSSWAKLFDAMETAIAAYGSKAWTQEYALGTRTLKFRDNVDFLKMYDRARLEVTREEQAAKLARGMGGAQRVMVRL